MSGFRKRLYRASEPLYCIRAFKRAERDDSCEKYRQMRRTPCSGAAIYIQENDSPARKTKWDLIAVEKEERLINMDSQVPNKVVREWIEEERLFQDVRLVRRRRHMEIPDLICMWKPGIERYLSK